MFRQVNLTRPGLCAIGLSLLYSALVCTKGVPVLRHDWNWPTSFDAIVAFAIHSTCGWSTDGIGAPSPYPVGYIIGPLLAVLMLALRPLGALSIFAFCIGLICTLSVARLGKKCGAPLIAIIAMQVFALYNPWVYNKTVAGHLYMILAYSGSYLLLNELLYGKRPGPLLLLAIIIELCQLQYFVVTSCVLAAAVAIRKQGEPLVWCLIVGSPIMLGIVLDRGSLLQIAYTRQWQVVQSVNPWDAMILQGYFAGYASAFGLLYKVPMVAFVCYLIATVARSRTRIAMTIAAFVMAAIVFASGTKGIAQPLYLLLVEHVPESAVFRELYDLIGCVVVAYVLCALNSTWRAKFWSQALCVAIGGVCLAMWLIYPPSEKWVSSRALPHAPLVRVEQHSRFALYPPFEPLTMASKGSGQDPERFARRGDVTPINTYVPSYPGSAALAQYAENGSHRGLAALSVSLVLERPWLRTDTRNIALETRSPVSNSAFRAIRLNPAPEMVLQERPQIGSLVNIPGAGNIYFGDDRNNATSSTLEAVTVNVPNTFGRAEDGWIAAPLLFIAHPEIAQGLGGAATTNRSDGLRLPDKAKAILAYVKGRLYAGNSILISSLSSQYRWLNVTPGNSVLRCGGLCAIAAAATEMPKPPLNPPPQESMPVTFMTFSPAMVTAQVPPHTNRWLRYDVAFDQGWFAISDWRLLEHARLDTLFNGWKLTDSASQNTVFIAHLPSILQFLCEIAVAIWLPLYFGITITRKPRSEKRVVAPPDR